MARKQYTADLQTNTDIKAFIPPWHQGLNDENVEVFVTSFFETSRCLPEHYCPSPPAQHILKFHYFLSELATCLYHHGNAYCTK
jgi:hypothetical protein